MEIVEEAVEWVVEVDKAKIVAVLSGPADSVFVQNAGQKYRMSRVLNVQTLNAPIAVIPW
ncbi:MAG: hypothetical protein AB7T22_16225 [Calditrichaceae bacterium]